MAEPNAKPDDAQPGPGQTEPTPEASPTSELSPLTAKDFFLASHLEPTDDTPTVISRGPLAAVRNEEAFSNMLRGRRLGHFELLGSIGVGGMAAVIRARDTLLDRTVALKILPPDMASDPEIVRRFHQEARAAAKLDHENIARVFFCGEDQGLHFIAFEMVEGENLKTILAERGKVPVPEAISYMLQIATGLAHAADRGVVHRDIKPSNIIISSNGRAKLVDMGLARSLEPNTDGGLTQSGVTLGTFDYISPEQALEPRDADVRSDIYSLGCTFYHMLTGEPPVPEGTAAKKLHHHQNVDPLDPRQLNPQIPDDVAALLARMMAKDPKDRYQRPEHLVQHLIVLAQKLGAVNEVPDAVLFVDAPLLRPPRARPLMVACLAGLALVVFVVLMGTPSGHNKQPRTDGGSQALTKSGLAPSSPTTATNTDSVAPAETAEGQNAADSSAKVEAAAFHAKDARDLRGLAEYLSQTPDAHVFVSTDFELSRDETHCDFPLVFQGRSLTIEPEPDKYGSNSRFTFSLAYDAKPGGSWSIFKFLAGNIRLHGLNLKVDAKGGEIPMSAIDWHGGRLTLEDCVCTETGIDNSQRQHVAALAITGVGHAFQDDRPDNNPDVELRSCYFAGGKDALFLAGPARVYASRCAFGPHTNALVEMAKTNRQEVGLQRNLWLNNCSAFLDGSAFQVDTGVVFKVHTENCVFSRPEEIAARAGSGVLIEQIGTSGAESQYLARGNCYHNLEGYYWTRSLALENRDTLSSLEAFKQKFPQLVRDERSVELSTSPWSETQPLKALEQDQPRRAFALRTDMPELRLQRDKRKMIGADRCAWGEVYSRYPLPALDRKPTEGIAGSQERIVDPSAETKANVYKKLSQAIDDAQPGDVLLIRFNGLLREDPVQIKDANASLTIRPYPGWHPILTIGQSPDPDAALIRLHDGKLTIENMEFRLVPDKAGYRAQSVVMIMGDGQCTLSNCMATLEGKEGTSLAFVTLNDPSAVMKMTPQPAQQEDPKVALSGCFIRGTGQMLSVRVSRPFELRAEDSLVVLNGSMLVVDANPKEVGNRSASITLNHLTTYLTEHLILLRALKENGSSGKGLVPTHVRSASDCLFASAGGNKAFVHLDGIDTEDRTRSYFFWDDGQHNAYSNYTQYLEQQPSSDATMPPPTLSVKDWKERDPDSRFEKVKFFTPPASDATMTQVTADNFKTKAEASLQGCGVNLERLPKPTEESGSEKSQEDTLKD